MPYLRLYARDVPIEEKRLIAQKLIDITLRAFHLRPDERSRITIQFVPKEPLSDGGVEPAGAPWQPADMTLEVSGKDLTDESRRVFVEQAAPLLTNSAFVKPKSRIARLIGIKADAGRQVAFQFKRVDERSYESFGADSFNGTRAA